MTAPPQVTAATATAERMQTSLAVLQPLAIDIVDDSAKHAGHAGAQSGGGHYRLSIVSPQFTGKSTLARHRLIYAALGAMMQREIHALAISALAPGE
jgi:BolA protein